MKNIILIITIFFSSLLCATTIEVNQDGSGDYIQIQDGIDNATAGDTIRVYPGRYVENIFIDKDLSLVSNFQYSADQADISNTIIDGNYLDTAVKLLGEENDYIDIYICGFRIENGGNYDIFLGGGLYSRYVNLDIYNNILTNNRAEIGGGLIIYDTDVHLAGNSIYKNHSLVRGGGIYFISSESVIFDEDNLNNIYLNFSGRGADIGSTYLCPTLEVIVDTFTVNEPDNFFVYSGDYSGGCYQPEEILCIIQNAKIEQVEADLYVAADGDDANSGLTPEEPLQNIHYAITKIKTDSEHPRTIHIADGVYSPSLNNQYFPLHLKGYLNIVGESRENTILDGEGESRGFFYGRDMLGMYYEDTYDQYLIQDYSVKNLTLTNGKEEKYIYIQENANATWENIECSNMVTQEHSLATLAHLKNSSFSRLYFHDNITSRNIVINSGMGEIVLENLVVKDNLPNTEPEIVSGGGCSILNNNCCHPEITVNMYNCEITNNVNENLDYTSISSALVTSDNAKVNLVNSTIVGNSSINGAAVSLAYGSELNIYNSIIYGNTPRQILVDGRYGYSNILTVQNSLVEGGYDDILIISSNDIYWDDETILDEDPQFIGEGSYPFALSEISACIDAGTQDLPEGLELPLYDLAGNPRISGENVDMGAYELVSFSSPINLLVDAVEGRITWEVMPGSSPESFNIFLNNNYIENIDEEINEYQFMNLEPNIFYTAGISAVYSDGESAIIEIGFTYSPLESENELLVEGVKISNYPNPFSINSNSRGYATNIQLELVEAGKTELAIYNIKGQKVKSILNAYVSSGKYSFKWDGKDNNGKIVASGNYVVKLKQNGNVSIKKMMVMK